MTDTNNIQKILLSLKDNFKKEGTIEFRPAISDQFISFYNRTKKILPEDFHQYFKLINGTNNVPLNNLYEFYEINNLKKISEEFKDWEGIPDYNILNFKEFENIYIFGNYEFNFYAFGIELHDTNLINTNKIFIFCGGEYKVIAKCFIDFIKIYLNNPEEIFV